MAGKRTQTPFVWKRPGLTTQRPRQTCLLDGLAIPEDAERKPQFVNERTKFVDFDGSPDLITALPDPESVDAAFTTERNSWKGIICPKCHFSNILGCLALRNRRLPFGVASETSRALCRLASH